MIATNCGQCGERFMSYGPARVFCGLCVPVLPEVDWSTVPISHHRTRELRERMAAAREAEAEGKEIDGFLNTASG